MSCTVDKKYLSRDGWSRVVRSRFVCREIKEGMAGLLYLEKVTKPLVTKCFADNFTIVDDGYYWMQIAPRDANWWLTVMLNERKEIVQYYFDITRTNVLRGRDSWFEDLMLDVVVLPDGTSVLLDQDELDMALEQGNITKAEHSLASRMATEIQMAFPVRFDELQGFVIKIRDELLAELAKNEK